MKKYVPAVRQARQHTPLRANECPTRTYHRQPSIYETITRELRGVHTTTMNGGVGKYIVEIYIRNVLATTEPTRLRTAAAVYMNTCRCSWWFGRWSACPSRSFSWVRGITDECMLEATFLA